MITQILAAFLLLGICIFFHELGHFLVGKWLGIRAKVFSIGYGRGVWFKKKGGTIYQITAIPLGGYVQFYGDDITRQHHNPKPGDFFAAGPWRRIATAVGGPLFSILLGFIVLFILIAAGWQPIANKIRIVGPQTLAARAGLQTGDKIIAVNGSKTPSYEKITYAIAFADSPDFTLTVEREGTIIELPVTIPQKEEGGIRMLEGIRPAGRPYLAVTTPKTFPNGNKLLKDDKIIAADGKPVTSVKDLIAILNQGKKDKTQLTVLRRTGSIISPETESTLTITVPLIKMENLTLRQLKDKQTGKIIPDYEILANQPELFTRLQINQKTITDWDSLKVALRQTPKNADGTLSLQVGALEMEALVSLGERRMLGMVLVEGVDAERANLPRDIFSLLNRTVEEMVTVTQGTLLGIYRILQGKLSFNKSISGPVKIMAVAAKSVTAGWETYWFLLAQITIILGIMNLLPIPVLDGGHIVFYLIEALYKPLPAQTIAASMRIGMILLITLGVYVIALDVWDVFIRGWF